MNIHGAGGRKNNFDLLRLILALVVVLVHASVLSGAPALALFQQHLSSSDAVMGFFVISGFLVTMSFERSSGIRRFWVKRARRIYPAYATVILTCTAAGLLLTRLSVDEYLASSRTWGYLLANLTFANFLQPTLPGVFEGNPAGAAVDGSLWSIRTEVACYLALPLMCVLCRRWRPVLTCAAAYLACVGAAFWLGRVADHTGSEPLRLIAEAVIRPGAYFVAGVFLFYGFDRFTRWAVPLVGLAVAAVVACRVGGGVAMAPLIEPAAFAVIVLYAAYGLPYLGNFGRFGDLSYGIYIYHFPILQVLISTGGFARHPMAMLAAAVGLTVLAALCSWHLIEKPWLRRDSHYVLANTPAKVDVSVPEPVASAAQQPPL